MSTLAWIAVGAVAYIAAILVIAGLCHAAGKQPPVPPPPERDWLWPPSVPYPDRPYKTVHHRGAGSASSSPMASPAPARPRNTTPENN